MSLPPTPPCDKFRNYRNRRYHNPNSSLDPPKSAIIPDLKKLSTDVKTPFFNESFFIEKYHQIEPKKLPSHMIKRGFKVLTAKNKKNLDSTRMIQELTVNESRISVDKTNVSKISTQDTNQSIYRANASFYENVNWKRSRSLLSAKKQECAEKGSEVTNLIPKPEKKECSCRANDKNEALLGKIKAVFMNFKEKHEAILRNFNDERRNKLKAVLRCPKLGEL